MNYSYCVVPHYDQAEPTKVVAWCVLERSSHRDHTLGCYPSKEEAEAACERMTAQHRGNVA